LDHLYKNFRKGEKLLKEKGVSLLLEKRPYKRESLQRGKYSTINSGKGRKKVETWHLTKEFVRSPG